MSNPVFLFLAGGAVLVALAFVVIPLLRSRLYAGALALFLGLPLATLALYQLVGTPDGASPPDSETAEIRAAVTELAGRAMAEPDDAERWARLAMAYKRLEEFSSAEHAFRRALYIDDSSDFLRVELAETLLYASGRPELPDRAREMLLRAAESGENQKALWLLGLDAFQREEYAAAEARFEQLLGLLPADGNVTSTVEQYLARARAGGRPGVEDPAPADGDGPRLSVSATIDESLAGRLSGEETVFVIVRDAAGRGPPLAVKRLQASALPASVRIDDGDAMMADGGLSRAESVNVVARVSFSGDASPAEGDFEGESGILPVEQAMEAEVHIDQVR